MLLKYSIKNEEIELLIICHLKNIFKNVKQNIEHLRLTRQ